MERSPGSADVEGAATAVTPSPRGEGQPITRGFLFADLRDYTAYVEARGDAAGASLLDVYRELMRETIGGHGGAEIKTEGDSFYVVFPSASAAVACGLAIAAAASIRTAADPERPIHVGVGIHAGESVEGAEGYVGSAVNIAARVCALAGPGEVLVTETVRSLMRTSGRLTFTSRGRRRLKGIAEPIVIFRVLPEGALAGRSRALLPGFAGAFLGRVAGSALGGVIIVVVVGLGLLGVAALGLPSGTPTGPPGGTSASPTNAGAADTGTRIVFSRQVPLGDDGGTPVCDGYADSKLYMLNPDSPATPVYRLTSATDLFEKRPSWSGDGSTLSFVGESQNDPLPDLFVTTAAGDPPELGFEQQRDGTFGFFPGNPRLSPDGSLLAWADGAQLWVAATGSPTKRAIAGTAPPEEEPAPEQPLPPGATKPPEPTPGPTPSPDLNRFDWVQSTDWLPDGHLLAVTTTEPQPVMRSRLESMAADGTDRLPLAIDLGALEFVERVAVSWDGRHVAVESHPIEGGSTTISIADVPSGRLRPLSLGADAASPAWGPDGTTLAYVSGNQLWTVDVVTQRATQLTHLDGALACSPAWHTAPPNVLTARPSPSPGAVMPFERGILVAGRYRIDKFQPNVELTVPAGWAARRNYADGFSLEPLMGPAGEIDSARLQVGFTTPCGVDKDSIVLGPEARDVVDWLKARPDLKVSAARPVNLGGYPGLSVDVTFGTQTCTAPDGPPPDLLMLFPVGQDIFHIGTDETIRFVTVNVRGQSVSFFVDAFSEFGPFANAAQPILDSITFPTP